MIDDELVEWQQRSSKNGLVQCWFTHPCLEWMEEQDWSNKTIVMFGAGRGDIWLAKKCKKLYVIERNIEWIPKTLLASIDIQMIAGVNLEYIYRPCNDSDGKAEYYLDIEGLNPDIIINDDAYRTECCQMAVDYFNKKEGGGILICDNWIQSYVWMSPKAEEIMMPYKAHIFEQSNHTNNDGINKWKTAYWNIPG
jgi:hypothetical protein